MSISSTGLSKHERKPLGRRSGREPLPARKRFTAPDPASLLFTREQTARLLNCSISTIIRHENLGIITKVKPSGEENGRVYHRAVEIRALADGD